MSGFMTMTAAANLNDGKYQRIDRSPSAETDECLSCEPYVSNRYLTCPPTAFFDLSPNAFIGSPQTERCFEVIRATFDLSLTNSFRWKLPGVGR